MDVDHDVAGGRRSTSSTALLASDHVRDADPDDRDSHAEEEEEAEEGGEARLHDPRHIFRNFLLMSVLFSIHHGCVVSCLSLATSQLGGDVGASQSSILYLAYTGSALVGATYMVKRLGPHRTLLLGMFLYCFYVAAFGLATYGSDGDNKTFVRITAYTGAFLGGLGAGLVWTAQGSFFAQAASAHGTSAVEMSEFRSGDQVVAPPSESSGNVRSQEQSTARMAGVFAFFYLSLELLLRSLSSVVGTRWSVLFNLYGMLTIMATVGMVLLVRPPDLNPEPLCKEVPTSTTLFYQVTAALQLWWPQQRSNQPGLDWPAMPFMLGLNAVFGLESAFLNAYINGQVVPTQQVGIWMAWASGVAALWSLVFGRVTSTQSGNAPRAPSSSSASSSSSSSSSSFFSSSSPVWSNRKGWVLSAGAIAFTSVVLPFAMFPTVESWTSSWFAPVVFFLIYTLHGTGRATFEGTLKATFADFFPYEKEGAFANIILQNGLSSSLGYFLTSHLACDGNSESDRYCIKYLDGKAHQLGWMETIIVAMGGLAIAGYWRAAFMVHDQQRR